MNDDTTAAIDQTVSHWAERDTRPKVLSDDDQAAALLAQVMRSAGMTQPQLARRLGVSRSLVQKWSEGRGGPARWLVKLRSVAPHFGGCLLRALVEHYDDQPRRGLAPLQHAALVASECGDVAREIHLATLDGTVDEQERRRIGREIAEAIAALVEARRDLVVGGSE